ncbi:MAG TPA: hypothetical protein VFS97_11140 [Nitrososphaeraceae archaeon]|nr:hypothetical protein [Nitrososphaeraceae archaeon]
MTFKDLQKVIQLQDEASINSKIDVQKLQGYPYGYLTESNTISEQKATVAFAHHRPTTERRP